MNENRNVRGKWTDLPILHRGGCVAGHAVARGDYCGVRVMACEACREIRFRGAEGGGPWEALGRLFGDYELVGRLDTIHSPASEVLAYRSRRPADAAALRVTPPHRWFKAAEGLWMCHDGSLLLLAHGSPRASRMVGA